MVRFSSKSVVSVGLVLSLAVETSVGHMSMQFPYPRDKIAGQNYLTWQQNEPMIGVHPTICHGLDVDTTVRSGNAFAAGDEIVIDLYGSASHNGGHCAFWFSTDDITFHKIIDMKDCTTAADDTVKVKLPSNMDAACTTKCTFAWTWSPVSSGACEVYMNCADISVSGVTGGTASGESLNFNTDILQTECERVGADKYTPLFGTVVEDYDYDTSDADTGNEVSGDVDEEELDEQDLCYKEGTRTDADIDSTGGKCAVNGFRCDTGQCCSEAGFCGPEARVVNGETKYCDYNTNPDSDCTEYWDSEEDAFAAYCDGNTGDWRLTSDCDYENGGTADYSRGLLTATTMLSALVVFATYVF